MAPVNQIEGQQAVAFGPEMKHPGVGLIFDDPGRPALSPGGLPRTQEEDR